MIIQLNPPIWVQTPIGESINTVWVVHQFDGGAIVHIDSSEVRVMGNAMYGISHPAKPTRVPLHK
jgi:hypothetical protein